MLEKNKDYVEFILQYTSVNGGMNRGHKEVGLNGYSDADFPCVPMDVVCKEFDHKVVMISKRAFDRLQADNEHYCERAKQWEENHNLLLQKTGFDTAESLVFYLTNARCDTLIEALANCCTEADALKTENESLRQKINELRDDISGRSTVIEHYKRDIEEWQKATGYLRPKDISTESMISKSMANDIKTANEKLWSENEKYEKENADLYAEIRKWKDLTMCETPEAAATWITSYESACGRGNRLAEMVEKLKEEVVSWKNVTGYSIPEDYMHARINCATPFDYTAAWKTATGCDTPDNAKSRIEGLENAIRLTNRNMIKEIESNIDEWQTATGCVAPEKAQCKITDLYNRIDKMKEAASIISNWTDKIVEG